MRPFLFILVTALTTLLSSCDQCGKVGCASEDFTDLNYRRFSIVDASTRKDLVFGPNPVYDMNLIKFYSLKGLDTTFFGCEPIRYPGGSDDSVLNVHFYPKTDVAYMRLSNGDIDTLNIFYGTIDVRCCGMRTTISKFRYNNAVDIPGDLGPQELRK